ncbi:hypothetical protein [Microcoleus sp. B3-D7]|uniref:hypothetical protein n=1 Tax=Microcoleus sp. B3-D7 TaxID=2818659 RepID=UPI002FD1D3C2
METLNNSELSISISRSDKNQLRWIASQPIEEAQKLLFAYTEEPLLFPGRKYDRATVELWAQSEPPEIRDTILKLYRHQFDDCELDLVEFVRGAIASGDTETAKQIQAILKEVCSSGHADRRKVWAALSQSEQSAFKALLAINSKPDSTNKSVLK